MEQMLWDAACSIRGEKDAAKFKDYLLPLLFLKRLSDVFDDEIDRLAEEYGDRKVAQEIAENDHDLLRFYLPPEARWGVISGRETHQWPLDDRGRSTRPHDIGEHLTRAVRAVVRQNPSLSGVIDLVDFASERNGERDLNPGQARRRGRDLLGFPIPARPSRRAARLPGPRLRVPAPQIRRRFRSERGRVLHPHRGRLPHGPPHASQARRGLPRLCLRLGRSVGQARTGRPRTRPHQPRSPQARRTGATSGQLRRRPHERHHPRHGCPDRARRHHDQSKFKTASGQIAAHDIVVANPMWNQPFSPDLFANDPFDRFRTRGGVTTGKGDWAWLQHTLACLNQRGRAAVVLDTGAMTRGSGGKHEDRERNIRKWFVDRDLIDGVILLPDNLFYNTSAAGVIVVLSKRKPTVRKDKIVLVNASRRVRKGRPKNYIPEEDIRPLAAAFAKGEPVEGEVAVITREQAQEADYNLSPSRWAGQAEKTQLGSIQSLIDELRNLNAQDAELTGDVVRMLAPLADVGRDD